MLVTFVLYGSKRKFFAFFIQRTINGLCQQNTLADCVNKTHQRIVSTKHISGLCQQNTLAQYNKENPSIWAKVILIIPKKDKLMGRVYLTHKFYQ